MQQLAALRHDKFALGTRLVTFLALMRNYLQKANFISHLSAPPTVTCFVPLG